MYNTLGWLWWAVVQLVMLFWEGIGFVLLIPFCLAQAWPSCTVCCLRESINPDNHAGVDYWLWEPLNWIYGNPEDGVSGRQARIWLSSGVRSPYMPNAWAPWRAYCWSACRNSCNNLKYVFAWKNGPRAMIGSHKVGWWPENGVNVPVW